MDADNAGVRFPPPLIYLSGLLIGIALEYLVGLHSFGVDRRILAAAGVALAFAGIALAMSAIALFRRAGTTPEPWSETTAIVTTGIYRRTRNPMYVGLTVTYVGLALAADAPIALILLPAVLIIIDTQVIAREERYLAARFGEPYREYCRRVRRWL